MMVTIGILASLLVASLGITLAWTLKVVELRTELKNSKDKCKRDGETHSDVIRKKDAELADLKDKLGKKEKELLHLTSEHEKLRVEHTQLQQRPIGRVIGEIKLQS